MRTLSIILSVLCFIFASLLGVSIYFNIKHGLLILKLQDAIEDSLDTLDKRYKSISSVLEIPVFFDSLEVRQVISDIEKSRSSLLYVANILTASTTEQGDVIDDAKGD